MVTPLATVAMDELGSITISFSGLAVGAITGIVLNAILPDNEYLDRNYT
jgi:xanthine/uracil permease